MEYLSQLNERTHLWVELGLQTIHEDTAKLINRAYPLICFEKAVQKLHAHNIETVVHLILGLPHETREQMLESAKYVSKLPLQGIKLHMLHVLDNAPLGKYYLENLFPILSEEEYITLIGEILCILPPDLVIHRLTGDGPAAHLIEPLWTKNKKKVLNDLNRYLKEADIYQGKSLNTY
ncbi:TIGR01212 family radical SAM protein [Cellulosilyticum ruminicola]|uniref:TIGR01212 family radical SAM protein n=1 Tax=Cellulosilyticum ruminicola TaxID=425254 RepID=UPI002E8E441E|nr:TIGR01212 family radical SAM protein [Cellulosilyticum ruminicola]